MKTKNKNKTIKNIKTTKGISIKIILKMTPMYIAYKYMGVI